MTGRRSLPTHGGRMSRQAQFVPGHVGGRVASAQPVQSRRTIGNESQTVPVVDVFTYFTSGGYLNWPTSNVVLEYVGGSDGETYVALLTCVGVPPLLPSGWTTILSGNVGSIGGGLYYRVGCIRWTAITPQEQIFTIDGTMSGTTNEGRMVVNMWSITGRLTPQCSVTTQAAATSHPFATPSGAWGSTWNMNSYVVPHPLGTSSASPTYDAGFTPYLVNYGEGAGYPFLCDDIDADQFGGSAAVTAHATTRTSVNAWDSASFAFGFTT